MSEVINWLSRSKGPEAVVIYADFYDYDLNTNIFKLPEEKEGVLKVGVEMTTSGTFEYPVPCVS